MRRSIAMPLVTSLCLALALGALSLARTADAQTRTAQPAKASPPKEAASPPKEAESGSKADAERGVKGPGSDASKDASAAVKAVKEEESPEGVKTYEFGAIEVEGRLRSPQILFFLRRVRAEFDGALLGHRSFLRELSDTRSDPAFR